MYRIIMPTITSDKPLFVVSMQGGDPERSYLSKNAMQFKSKKNAEKFLAKLQKEYPNRFFEIEEF